MSPPFVGRGHPRVAEVLSSRNGGLSFGRLMTQCDLRTDSPSVESFCQFLHGSSELIGTSGFSLAWLSGVAGDRRIRHNKYPEVGKQG
jgi:hypothetical protein